MEFDHRKLRRLRNKREMSQDDVAEKAGLKTEAYVDFEDGREAPSEWWVKRIAFALTCEPTAFFSTVAQEYRKVLTPCD